MKGIYRFHWDCGRMGEVNGIFVADSDKIKSAIGKQVYFGEILGKHSDIEGTLEDGECQLLSENNDDIEVFERLDLTTGYNPLDYINDYEKD